MTDRRAKFREGLSSLYTPIYDALCAKLPLEWQPYYGLRTFAEQDALYASGRTVPGHIVTDAKAGESPHNYGCASDWTLWTESGQPLWLVPHDAKWLSYVRAIEDVKGRSGALFSLVDMPHNELPISVNWKTVLACKNSGGNVETFLKEHMV